MIRIIRKACAISSISVNMQYVTTKKPVNTPTILLSRKICHTCDDVLSKSSNKSIKKKHYMKLIVCINI